MFKRTLIAASLTVAALASAQAMAVTGGGATLPAALYKGSADSILPANFSYEVTGSGTGKQAFLENRADLFKTTGTNTFSAVTGNSVEALVLYVDTGSASTSRLVAYIDSGVTGLPVTPNGGDITITWNASGIFQL